MYFFFCPRGFRVGFVIPGRVLSDRFFFFFFDLSDRFSLPPVFFVEPPFWELWGFFVHQQCSWVLFWERFSGHGFCECFLSGGEVEEEEEKREGGTNFESPRITRTMRGSSLQHQKAASVTFFVRARNSQDLESFSKRPAEGIAAAETVHVSIPSTFHGGIKLQLRSR